MNKWTPRGRGMSRLVLLSTILIAAGHAHAQVPVTSYLVVNPVVVCTTSGTGCAPFNTLGTTPAGATTSTPIGFVDTTTNINLTRAMWLQAGIDVTFLPIRQYNNTKYQTINDITCLPLGSPSACTSLSSALFSQLSGRTAATADPLCKTNCTVPIAPTVAALTSANAINMFFVNVLSGANPAPGGVGVSGTTLAGFSWLNGNASAINSSVFQTTFALGPRFDTLAHEIGHTLNLDHTTFGAGAVCFGVASPGQCNLMDSGANRNVPDDFGCSSTKSGALFDLDTNLCGTCATCAPAAPQADQLILGKGTTRNPTQQSEALLSNFLNPIPNVTATAGGGAAATAAATLVSGLAAAPAGGPIDITLTAPTLKRGFGGRPGQSIVAVVLALPQGFHFGQNFFVPGSSSGTVTVFGFERLNGNNGQGNSNCLKPLNGGPSIECLEIDFDEGTFTAGNTFSFTTDIINKSTNQEATLGELACTPPETGTQCLDLTYVFDDLLATSSAFIVRDTSGDLTSNSQFPDTGVTSTIVNQANFPSIANNPNLTTFQNANGGANAIPCTGSSVASCGNAGGAWNNSEE